MSQIVVTERSELMKSKKGKVYFTVKDTEGNTYVCYHPNQHPDFEPAANPEVKISPSSNPDYSPSIELVGGERVASSPASPKQTIKPQVKSEGRELSFAQSYAKDVFVAYIGAGRFKDSTPAAIATNINQIAKGLLPFLSNTDKIVEEIVEEIEQP